MSSSINAQSLETLVFTDDEVGVSVLVGNKRTCIDPNGQQATATCPDVTAEEAAPCPSGPCFSHEARNGCVHVSGNNKASQREHLNSGSFTNRISPSQGQPGKKPAPNPQTIECYRKRQCKCTDEDTGNWTCKEGPWKTFAIAKYETTNDPCWGAVSIEE
jgi:hypothetical protein